MVIFLDGPEGILAGTQFEADRECFYELNKRRKSLATKAQARSVIQNRTGSGCKASCTASTDSYSQKTDMAFTKGQSGNPAGGPKGSGKSVALRKSIEKNIPFIVSALLTKALEGDATAARLLLERVVPALPRVKSYQSKRNRSWRHCPACAV